MIHFLRALLQIFNLLIKSIVHISSSPPPILNSAMVPSSLFLKKLSITRTIGFILKGNLSSCNDFERLPNPTIASRNSLKLENRPVPYFVYR